MAIEGNSMQTAVKIPENLKLTYEDYLLLPEGTRYEIIEGELFMTPSPRTVHQRLIVKLFRIIDNFVRGKNLGEVFVAPYDVVLSKHDIVQPDILFVSIEDRDSILKKKLYAAFGVKEYWIADPAKKSVKLFNLGKKGYMDVETGNIFKSLLLKGLEIDISGLFEDVIKH